MSWSSRRPTSRVSYGSFLAIRDINLRIGRNEITALIGPSGCGKSTLLRCFNRMNDLVQGARVEGLVAYHGQDLYGPDVDPIEVRQRIGMVFQKPNPFPKSIFDNVAFGPRVVGMEVDDMGALVKDALRTRRPMGRGEGQAQGQCALIVGWPTAAALHCPVHRSAPGGHPHGRAGVLARSRSRRRGSRTSWPSSASNSPS